MKDQFKTTRLFPFNILAIVIGLSLITTSSSVHHYQNALGQAEEVFGGNATFIEEIEEQGQNTSSSAERIGVVSEDDQTFMETEISDALSSSTSPSSIPNQTTSAPAAPAAPTTTDQQQTEAATVVGNNDSNIFNLTIGSSTYPITYNITGGKINNITAVQPNSTLIVDLTSNDDGTFTIQIPRNIMDSKSPQNEDQDYIVFVDGVQTDAEETTSNNQTRVLSVDFENGVEQLEISGTRIVPEFGSAISMLLLSVSILGILTFAAKFRKFHPLLRRH